MGYNKDKILEALTDKRLSYLKKSYLKLDTILTNNQRSSIKKKIKSTTPNGFRELLISYFQKYVIDYDESKDRSRKPEKKENLVNRQKKFTESKKAKKQKKLQVYLSEYDYGLLETMKKSTGKTYAEIIKASLWCQYTRFSTWSK